MIPNYFFVTLSICIAVLTIAVIFRTFKQVRLRRRHRHQSDLQDMVDELEYRLKQNDTSAEKKGYQKGILDFINISNDEYKLGFILEMVKVANSLPTVNEFGWFVYDDKEKKVLFVVK